MFRSQKGQDWILKQLNDANRPVTTHSVKSLSGMAFLKLTRRMACTPNPRATKDVYYCSEQRQVLHAGIIGKGRKRWREIKSNYTGDWLIHSLGELEEEEISQYLLSLITVLLRRRGTLLEKAVLLLQWLNMDYQ